MPESSPSSRDSRLEALFTGYVNKTLSEEERVELFSLVQAPANEPYFKALIERFMAQGYAVPGSLDLEASSEILESILQADPAPAVEIQARPVHRVHFLRRWGWAAAAVLAIGTAAAIMLLSERASIHERAGLSHASAVPEILPATNKAVLTLSDGTTIALDGAANGAIARQGNSSVVKLANGGIRYDVGGEPQGKAMMNMMSTPRGGQYQLTLPDQTHVWLNAASTIVYPTSFQGKERRITVNGEAYFEIAPDKSKPFIVETNHGEIAVLGTRFNVNAYEDENASAITLLQGSVRVSPGKSGSTAAGQSQGVVLNPGQQAVLAYGDHRSIGVNSNVDVNKIMAWKEGLFDFENMGLQEVMRELARWYDLDIQYEKGVPDMRFGGGMSRNVPLSDVLKGLENMDVHFKIISGRKLIVMP